MPVAYKEELLSKNAKETILIGRMISSSLSGGDVICLSGALGAGKSQLAKGIISSLTGIDIQDILSPTYTYMNFYEGETDICHFDLYRLTSTESFEKLGFEDYLLDNKTLSIIEWPDKIQNLLPENTLDITIDYLDNEQRLLKLNFRVNDDSI